MRFGEIIREVRGIIKDASPDILASIPDYINEVLGKVAGEHDLPVLRTVFPVVTDTTNGYVSLDNRFDGRLLYAGTVEGELSIAKRGVIELLEDNPDLTVIGNLKKVAVENGLLWYRKIPEVATTITCIGYYNPSLLEKDADTPDCLPIYLHRDILVYGAAAKAYSIIEDGLETGKPNTAYYSGMMGGGVVALETWLAKRKSNLGRSVYEAR